MIIYRITGSILDLKVSINNSLKFINLSKKQLSDESEKKQL